MAEPAGRHWGYDLGRHAHVRSGSLYPVLRRLLDEGLLADGWEDPSEAVGRPPRRYYTLTEKGLRELGALLSTAQRDPRFAAQLQELSWT
jgi:PadR family transcriptional regulator PadR